MVSSRSSFGCSARCAKISASTTYGTLHRNRYLHIYGSSCQSRLTKAFVEPPHTFAHLVEVLPARLGYTDAHCMPLSGLLKACAEDPGHRDRRSPNPSKFLCSQRQSQQLSRARLRHVRQTLKEHFLREALRKLAVILAVVALHRAHRDTSNCTSRPQ